jgi:hypothetical protein
MPPRPPRLSTAWVGPHNPRTTRAQHARETEGGRETGRKREKYRDRDREREICIDIDRDKERYIEIQPKTEICIER